MKYRQLNTDIVPIKSLYFEPGAKLKIQAKNTVVCMATLLSLNGHMSSHFDTIHLNVNICVFCTALSLLVVRI